MSFEQYLSQEPPEDNHKCDENCQRHCDSCPTLFCANDEFSKRIKMAEDDYIDLCGGCSGEK